MWPAGVDGPMTATQRWFCFSLLPLSLAVHMFNNQSQLPLILKYRSAFQPQSGEVWFLSEASEKAARGLLHQWLWSTQHCVCMLSRSVTSKSFWPHQQAIRLLCPCNFPGKHTGVGCHFFLLGIFPIQGSNLCLLLLLHRQADSLALCHLWALQMGSVSPNIGMSLSCKLREEPVSDKQKKDV